MEKRFVLFLVLAMAVIFGHLAVVQMLHPPVPPDPLAEREQVEPPEPLAADEPQIPAIESLPSPDADAPVPEEAAAVEQAPVRHPQKWISLGSFAGDKSQPLHVILSSRGAAIERIELTERTKSGQFRYRDLERRSGYLGALALTPVVDGCQVNVVGAGTPAEQAQAREGRSSSGILVGDVITRIENRPVRFPFDLDQVLDQHKPGDRVALTVRRNQDGGPHELEYQAVLAERPLELVRPEPLARGAVAPDPPSLLTSVVHLGGKDVPLGQPEFAGIPSLRNSDWEVEELNGTHPGVEFRLRLDPAALKPLGITGDLEIVKRYRLAPADHIKTADGANALHHLQVEVELRNRGAEPLAVGYRLDGPNGLTLEGWWYLSKIHPHMFASAGARDVLYRTAGQLEQMVGTSEAVKYAQKNPKAPDKPLFAESDEEQYRTIRFAAMDTQFFLAALIPDSEGAGRSDLFRRGAVTVFNDVTAREKSLLRTANVSFYLVSPVTSIAPGSSLQHNFLLFAGPKDTRLLAAYGLEDAVYYGWFWWVAKPLSSILHFFYGIVGNYGLAIILLTVLVRGCMFPLSRKAAKNAAMMQELAPEMRQIAEKYKADMEKRARAQRELFRKYNYNPFGGCWLMFLQLPVFIGLYRSLAVDIELRQAPLIPGIEWASNLAGPDMLYYWEWLLPSFLASETGLLGPYFNLLPLITMGLFLVHQQLFTPPATDEQTRMQMQMMKFMTVFIGFMFFKVASGLCLYFIASSLWSVAERVLLPKQKPEVAAAKASGPGLLERLMAKIEDNGAKNRPPASRKRQRRVR